MHEKTHENIKTIRPLKDGVIADFHAAEHMIRGLIKMIDSGKRFFPVSIEWLYVYLQELLKLKEQLEIQQICWRKRSLYDT